MRGIWSHSGAAQTTQARKHAARGTGRSTDLSDTQWTSATAPRFARDQEAATGGTHAVEHRQRGTNETGCGSASQGGSGTLVFADPASRALLKMLARVAPSDVPIVISGEAGTGKGALARQI